MNQNFDAYKAQVTRGEKDLKNNGVGMVDAYRVRLLPGFEVLLRRVSQGQNDAKSGLASPDHNEYLPGLFLGYIEAEFCREVLVFILRHLSRSTKSVHFCTAPDFENI